VMRCSNKVTGTRASRQSTIVELAVAGFAIVGAGRDGSNCVFSRSVLNS